MKLPSCLFSGSVVALLMFAPNAQAMPITYEITSVVSGQIGMTSFTDAQVHLIATGDTDTAVSGAFGPYSYFANPFSTFTVNIAGIGTATITDLSAIWSFPQPIPGLNPLPAVLFGRIDHPPALDSFTGIGFALNNALAGYDTTTAIGPLTGPGTIAFNPACSTPGNNSCIHTSLGLLRFTSNDLEDGDQATFVATVTPVPEPATLVLLGSGVATLVGRSRSRTRRSEE